MNSKEGLDRIKELIVEKKIWASAYGCDNLDIEHYDLWLKGIEAEADKIYQEFENGCGERRTDGIGIRDGTGYSCATRKCQTCQLIKHMWKLISFGRIEINGKSI